VNEWSKEWCEQEFGSAVEDYRASHDFCALCGIRDEQCHWPHRSGPLQLAHIFAGPHRKCHPAAVLMLCERCHRHEHTRGVVKDGVRLPLITKGVLLGAKAELGELDCETLAKITGYQAGYIRDLIEPIPNTFLLERKAWR
jgi:hypothetical protein